MWYGHPSLLCGITYVSKLVSQKWSESVVWSIANPNALWHTNVEMTVRKSLPWQLTLQLRDACLTAHRQVPGCNSKCTNMVQCMEQHLKQEFKATGYIRLVSWDQFTQGSKVHVVEKPNNSTTCVRRAISKIWKPARYDLMHRNCEHFTTWCCTGMSVSKQSDAALKLWAPDLHRALLQDVDK